MRSRLIPVLVALTILASACAGGEGSPTTTTPTPTSTIQPTTTTPPPSTVFDWDDRAATATVDGWTVGYCEGDAPFLCIEKDGAVVGLIEIFVRDPLTYTAYDPTTTDDTNLRALAADFVEAFEADRPSGCGAGYLVEAVEPQPFGYAGTDGLVHGFRGTFADGTPSELHLQYAALSHGRLIVLLASAYDEAGCPGKDDTASFDVDTLEEFRPVLEQLLADSPAPGGDADTGFVLPDGQVFAWILAVDGGLVVDPALVLSGEEARLQAIADGVIPDGEDLPNDIYLYNPTSEAIMVRVADDVKWLVIAPGADGGLASRETDLETISSILAGGDTGDIYGLTPEFMPFDLLVIDGVVVEISERYLP
jgi:hypothetical protein